MRSPITDILEKVAEEIVRQFPNPPCGYDLTFRLIGA